MTSLNKIQRSSIQKPQDKSATKFVVPLNEPWFNVWEYIIGAIITFATLIITIGTLGHYAPSFNLKSVAILLLIFLMTLWQVWLLAKLLLAPVLLFFTQFKTGSKPKDGNKYADRHSQEYINTTQDLPFTVKQGNQQATSQEKEKHSCTNETQKYFLYICHALIFLLFHVPLSLFEALEYSARAYHLFKRESTKTR